MAQRKRLGTSGLRTHLSGLVGEGRRRIGFHDLDAALHERLDRPGEQRCQMERHGGGSLVILLSLRRRGRMVGGWEGAVLGKERRVP
jgi:hypothetical protein